MTGLRRTVPGQQRKSWERWMAAGGGRRVTKASRQKDGAKIGRLGEGMRKDENLMLKKSRSENFLLPLSIEIMKVFF